MTRTISTSTSYEWRMAIALAPVFAIAAGSPFLTARAAALQGGSAIFGSPLTERVVSAWMIGAVAHAPARSGAINLLEVSRGIKHAAARQLSQLEHIMIGESNHGPGALAGSRQVAKALVDALVPVLGTASQKIVSGSSTPRDFGRAKRCRPVAMD